jgi:hypothetical protein
VQVSLIPLGYKFDAENQTMSSVIMIMVVNYDSVPREVSMLLLFPANPNLKMWLNERRHAIERLGQNRTRALPPTIRSPSRGRGFASVAASPCA